MTKEKCGFLDKAPHMDTAENTAIFIACFVLQMNQLPTFNSLIITFASYFTWVLKSDISRAKQCFYTSMVQPIVEYGCNIWSPVSKKNLMHIEAIQRRATKYITNDNVANYKSRLIACNLLPLAFRRDYLDANLLYKTIHGYADQYILSALTFNNRKQYLISNGINIGDIVVQIAKSETYKHYFTHRIAHIWNSIPTDIRSIPYGSNGSQFKLHLKRFFDDKFIRTFNPDNTCTWVCKCRCAFCRY